MTTVNRKQPRERVRRVAKVRMVGAGKRAHPCGLSPCTHNKVEVAMIRDLHAWLKKHDTPRGLL